MQRLHTLASATIASDALARELNGELGSSGSDAGNPVVWVITECYPRPAAPNSCAFAHRQLVAVRDSGWVVRVLVPNGWYPRFLWCLAPAWREAHARALPSDWACDGIPARDLRVQNRVPSRLSYPLSHVDRVELALGAAIAGADVRPSMLLVEFALPYGGAVSRAAAAFRIPYAVHLRGDDVWIWPHRSAAHMTEFRNVIHHAALVVGVSSAIVREALRLADEPDRSAAVVRNGVDLAAFTVLTPTVRAGLRMEFGMEQGDVAILCVASELEMKGWNDLLDAIGTLPSMGPRFCLYGAISGAHRDLDVEAEARRRAPNVRLRLFRELPHQRLAALYAASDIFALASHSEGLSNAVLEAMASGLSVIATHVGGHSEVIEHGVDGLLVEPRDVEALRAALQMLRLSGVRRRDLGAAARITMERLGDARQAGFRLADELRRIVEQRNVPHAT